MNSVANGKVRTHTPFRELYVQPAASDNGTALGAAYFVSRRFDEAVFEVLVGLGFKRGIQQGLAQLGVPNNVEINFAVVIAGHGCDRSREDGSSHDTE